jgi:hypothetical protein
VDQPGEKEVGQARRNRGIFDLVKENSNKFKLFGSNSGTTKLQKFQVIYSWKVPEMRNDFA